MFTPPMVDPEIQSLRRPKIKRVDEQVSWMERRMESDKIRAKPNPMMRRRELGLQCAGILSKGSAAHPPDIEWVLLGAAGSAEFD